MKQDRQRVILELIRNNEISTQNQLLDALNAAGVNSTQATLSRDIKELNLVKEFSKDGVYRYTVTDNDRHKNTRKLRAIFKEGVIGVACAQNIVVLRTIPGLAPAACSAIDHMNIDGLVGTIAGDDTAFLAMKDSATAEQFRKDMEEDIGE